jgi:glycosyltransferase involved in cell wall biosynthesis
MLPGANPAQPMQGIFVSEQIDALRTICDTQVDVITVNGFASRTAYLRSATEVLRRLRNSRYDVVHYHFGLTAWSAVLVRLLSRARIVVTLHGSDVLGGRLTRLISRVAARFAHACIAVSDEIAHEIKAVNSRCVTIPCGVNDALFKPGERAEDANIPRIVVFPSNASRQEKDYPLFQRVMAIVKQRSRVPIAERHIDGLDRESVCRLLQGADAMLMTSRREGSPQSVKEAMACGLPVISVDVGDVAHLLANVSGCYVTTSREPDELATSLIQVLEAGERTDGPKHLASRGYLSTQVAERVHAVYLEVLSHIKSKGLGDSVNHGRS